MINEFEDAAIVGYWRCGATSNQIADLLQMNVEEIVLIIYTYKAKLNEQSKN